MRPVPEQKETGPAREQNRTEPASGIALTLIPNFNVCGYGNRKAQAAMSFTRYRDAVVIGDADEAADALARFTALTGGAL